MHYLLVIFKVLQYCCEIALLPKNLLFVLYILASFQDNISEDENTNILYSFCKVFQNYNRIARTNYQLGNNIQTNMISWLFFNQFIC